MKYEPLKYPRTYHLPWSEGVHSDDKLVKNTHVFEGMEIVVTEKMDGESTSMYRDYMHARSVSSAHNFTRDWAKKMHSILSHDIPEGYIFSFENLAYVHSIEYDSLESFCYLLSIWKEDGYCLSYDEQCQWAEILELAQPKVLYRGPYDAKILQKLSKDMDLENMEGYVIRNTDSFHRNDFGKNVAKFVRKDHVQPNHAVDDTNAEVEHWLKNTYPNRLADPTFVKPSYMAQKADKKNRL
jgi:hypothetical protein